MEIQTLYSSGEISLQPLLLIYLLSLSNKGALLVVQQRKEILSAFVMRQRETDVLVLYTNKQLDDSNG